MIPLPLCNIIIDYLTMPPKLPFEEELLKITWPVKLDLDYCTYYGLYFKDIRQGHILILKCGIRRYYQRFHILSKW